MANLKAVLFRAQTRRAGRGATSFWRRSRVRACAALLVLSATLAPNALESAAANGDTRTLYLYHSHSKESIAATFRVNGHYDAATLEKLNWFLRDWRNDEQIEMDPKLFDVLWEAYRANDRMGPDDPIVVVSAYRCPATNAMLRRRSRAVAKHSQHMLGKAMDTTMPGLSMEQLREVGMRMQRGGVGYYPNAGTPFVHLDVGGVRHWPRMTYDQLVRLFPDGKTVHIPSNGKLLPGYEEARAEILARGGEAISVAEAQNSGGGLRGFFASLFGGGEDDDEVRQSAPVQPTRVASRGARDPQVADGGEDEGGEVARLEPQRRLMAKAETNLPRGETFMGAPPEVAPAPAQTGTLPPARALSQEQPAPSVPTARPEPANLEPVKPEPAGSAPVKPEPVEGASSEEQKPHPLDEAPPPPKRPADLGPVEADAPLPPPRPVELAGLPTVITHGAGAPALRPSAGAHGPLAFATAPEPSHPVEAEAPLPPPRPSMPALRPAAAVNAEQRRADRAAAAQMAPARADRAALSAMLTPAPQGNPRSAAAAPALRAATASGLLAAAPTAGATARFGAKAATPDANAFSKASN